MRTGRSIWFAAVALAAVLAAGCAKPEDQTMLRFLGFQAAGSSGSGTISAIEGDARDGAALKVDASFENQTVSLDSSGGGTGGITVYRVDVDYTMPHLDPPSFSNAVNLYAPPAAVGSKDSGGGTVLLSDIPVVPVFVKQWLVQHNASGGDGFIEMMAHVDFRARTDAGEELTVSAALGVTLTDSGGDGGGGGGGGATPPAVTIKATAPNAVDSGSGTDGQFTVYRTGDKTSTLTVNYTVEGTAVSADTCASGIDYESLDGTVAILAGGSSSTIDVVVCPDSVSEATRTVIVKLSAGSGYSTGTQPNSATVFIRDSD